jgi:hypothetical protein
MYINCNVSNRVSPSPYLKMEIDVVSETSGLQAIYISVRRTMYTYLVILSVCLCLFGPESFVFSVAVEKLRNFNIYNYIYIIN